MPSQNIEKHKNELNVLSDCNSAVFKALVNSKKELVECLLEILDNVAHIRLELDKTLLEKLSEDYQFFENILSTRSASSAKSLLLKNIEITQTAIKAALPLINSDDDD